MIFCLIHIANRGKTGDLGEEKLKKNHFIAVEARQLKIMAMKKKTMTKAQRELVTAEAVLNFIRKEAKINGRKHPSIGEDEFYSIGLETACIGAMAFLQKTEETTFLEYIKKYVSLEMKQRIRKDVFGVHRERNGIIWSDVVMIEELNLGDSNSDDDDPTFEEKLSLLVDDMDDDRKAKWERLEPLMECLTAEEREIVLIRYGFFDNHGETARRYMKKHKLKKTAFYDRAEAAVMKMRSYAIDNH